MNKWQENDIQSHFTSRRSFFKKIAHGLPFFSSAVSSAVSWVLMGPWETVYNIAGEAQDKLSDTSILESVVSRELSVSGGVPMTFVWIIHIPNQASQIWQKIDQILQWQNFDVVLTEGHLEKYMPPGLREWAIDIDRSPAADDLISLISCINLIICHQLNIKSDREKFIKRRLALMYFLTAYNLLSPSSIIKISITAIFWKVKIPPFLNLDYTSDGRSVFMLQECIKYAREWKKVLFLSGWAHTRDAQWYCDHPEIFEVKKGVNEFMYRWLHELGR